MIPVGGGWGAKIKIQNCFLFLFYYFYFLILSILSIIHLFISFLCNAASRISK
jgi:hypothetical protein